MAHPLPRGDRTSGRTSRRRPRRWAPALPAVPVMVAVLVAFTAAARSDSSDYVGAKACASCHAGTYQAWQQSVHARADATLGPSPPARCLACHTTGEAPAGQPYFAGVQCEACHGPGAGYASDDVMRDPALSRLMGLRDLSTPAGRAALCAECHRATTRLMPFEPEAAMKRLQHP